jgi:hypothetical protein
MVDLDMRSHDRMWAITTLAMCTQASGRSSGVDHTWEKQEWLRRSRPTKTANESVPAHFSTKLKFLQSNGITIRTCASF